MWGISSFLFHLATPRKKLKCSSGRLGGLHLFSAQNAGETAMAGTSSVCKQCSASLCCALVLNCFLLGPIHPQARRPSVSPNDVCSNPLYYLDFIILKNKLPSTWPVSFWSFPLVVVGNGVMCGLGYGLCISFSGNRRYCDQWEKLQLLVYVSVALRSSPCS